MGYVNGVVEINDLLSGVFSHVTADVPPPWKNTSGCRFFGEPDVGDSFST
jgi:hypothetical protein